MKIFGLKSGFLQKTIVIVLTVLCINFIVPSYSSADIGGVLIDPVVDLLAGIGDGIINILQRCMTGAAGANFSLTDGSGFLVREDSFWGNGEYSKFQGGSATETVNPEEEFNLGWFNLGHHYYIPTATYSPEQIFTGSVAGLDINFINPRKYDTGTSSAEMLQETIAGWYVALRNLSIVGLLSVLVYIGIRIITSSTAGDKAKYKQMLMDWLIALCILFFMHYIMSFTLTMVESITTAIAGNGDATVSIDVVGGGTLKTNLLGAARFKLQYSDFGSKMAYLIMYLALVIYTLVFTWFYLKRLLMMAFLTIIAPLVALTYPIDKIQDGKAQAFESWLKEYVFNALIQPFHLIIYTVFVGTAMDLARTNIIYMIAALGFILSAEKILRGFFGFGKAGATLGALKTLGLASMANRLTGGGKGRKPVSGGSDKRADSGDKPIRFEGKHDVKQVELPQGSQSQNTQTSMKTSNAQYDTRTETRTENRMPNNPEDIRDSGAETMASERFAEELRNEDTQGQQQVLQARPDDSEDRENRANREDQSDKQDKQAEKANKNSPLKNWANYHNISASSIAKGVGKRAWSGSKRVIGGTAKFATRHAFRAATGTFAAAVAAASGGGIEGALAAYTAGANIGQRLSNPVIQAESAIGRGLTGAAEAGYRGVKTAGSTAINNAVNGTDNNVWDATKKELLGGTALGRELDIAYSDSKYKKAGELNRFKNDENNLRYLRDQMAAKDPNGNIPSMKEVRSKMNTFDPYLTEGMTDIKDIMGAQKLEDYGVSAKQAAVIANIGKEKGITEEVLNDEKKYNSKFKNIEYEHLNKGYSEEEAKARTEYIMNSLKVQKGVANDMKKIKHPTPVKPQKLNPANETKTETKPAPKNFRKHDPNANNTNTQQPKGFRAHDPANRTNATKTRRTRRATNGRNAPNEHGHRTEPLNPGNSQ